MKQPLLKITLLAFAGIMSNSSFCQPGHFGNFFTHEVTLANTSNNESAMSHPDLNGNPSAKMIATANWGSSGVYADFKFGVYYNGSGWSVFNQNILGDMPAGVRFNILIPTENGTIFSHTSSSTNIASNSTKVDNPALNGNSNAIFFITNNWGTGSAYNNNNTGVWYDGANWNIYNENSMPFPEAAVYDIFVPTSGNANAFVHTATASTISGNYTIIDNALTNNKPDRVIFATHNFGGSKGIINDNPIGVWYTGSEWSVFNQNDVDMPEGAMFNILVADSMSTGIEEQTANANFMTVFPNPTNENQTIGYVINEPSAISLKVVNLMGQDVKTIFTGNQVAGNYTINAALSELATGTYYYLLNVNGAVSRKALIKQ